MFLAFRDAEARDWRSNLAIALGHRGAQHRLQFHHIFPKTVLRGSYKVNSVRYPPTMHHARSTLVLSPARYASQSSMSRRRTLRTRPGFRPAKRARFPRSSSTGSLTPQRSNRPWCYPPRPGLPSARTAKPLWHADLGVLGVGSGVISRRRLRCSTVHYVGGYREAS